MLKKRNLRIYPISVFIYFQNAEKCWNKLENLFSLYPSHGILQEVGFVCAGVVSFLGFNFMLLSRLAQFQISISLRREIDCEVTCRSPTPPDVAVVASRLGN